MRNKIVLALVFLVGLVLILIWIGGGFHSKVPGGRVPDVRNQDTKPKTIQIRMTQVPGEVTVSGTVVPRQTARLASKVQGYVTEIKFEAGDSVKKGDLLVKLDSRELSERKAQAEAALAGASAALTRARSDFNRLKGLYEKQAISTKQLDDARAAFDVARAAEIQAKAALQEAETTFSYSRIVAPFDGIVGERPVNLGDMVTPGRFLLSVYSPIATDLQARVAEQYAGFLKEGTEVTVEIPSLNLTQKSRIREVVPQRDERSRTILVKAALEEAPGMAPGLYGTMTIATKTSQVILIPRNVITTVGQLQSVRVVEDGVIKVRHVKTGRVLDNKVEILSGLKAGEEVVVE
jgi:RND family efflux transporter MFP subunit